MSPKDLKDDERRHQLTKLLQRAQQCHYDLERGGALASAKQGIELADIQIELLRMLLED